MMAFLKFKRRIVLITWLNAQQLEEQLNGAGISRNELFDAANTSSGLALCSGRRSVEKHIRFIWKDQE